MALINNLLDKLSEYIRLKGEKLKLDIIAQVSWLLAHFVAYLTMGLVLLFLFIFLSLALSAYLNSILSSPHYGYLIVSGVYLIMLFGLIILLRSNKLQVWLEAFFVSLSENLEDDNNE